jgi:murein DD-endopeptidase MepM/ murein hydrolase activator NlpD
VSLRRVTAGLAAIVLLAAGVAAALAEPPPTTTTDVSTTTAAATTGTTSPSTSSTSTVATTIATTSAATTPVAPPTTSAPMAAATPAQEVAFGSGCPMGGIALLLPNRPPAIVGAIASAHSKTAQFGGLVYPAGGSVATASAVSLSQEACTRTGPTNADAQLQDVSLFDGAVTARVVTLRLGRFDSASFSGLVVEGRDVGAGEQRIALQSWGYVVTGSHVPLAATGGGQAVAALSLYLTRARAGLPAGTAILVAVAGVPAGPASATKVKRHVAHGHNKARRATHEPLKVTPPLGLGHYIFPVVGPSDYIDTYGAFRSDVPGNWHHGDDIFAPLGAPVVAVASGTINRVGWEKLGGWRLWVRDSVGDEFYYAHLSGYAPHDLHTNRVRAGEVIGFLGNTGDAFTTSPHLHFEVHPRSLLHLGYDGAVDPTTYLNGWTHLEHVDAPRPIHPPLPKQPLIRREASYVFRELLAARHLIRHAPKASQRPHVPIPPGANGLPVAPRLSAGEATPTVAAGPKGMSTPTVAIVTVLSGLALLAAVTLLPSLRQRLRRGAPPPDESGAPAAASGGVEDESPL